MKVGGSKMESEADRWEGKHKLLEIAVRSTQSSGMKRAAFTIGFGR